MTLHWWMHWFWVTLWFTVIAGIPLSLTNRGTTAMTTTAGLTTGEEERTGNDHVTTSNLLETLSGGDEGEIFVKESLHVENEDIISTSPSSHLPPSPSVISLSSSRENFRVPKAIGVNPTPSPSPSPSSAGVNETKYDTVESRESPSNLTMIKNDYRVDRDAKIDKNSVLKLDEGSNYTSDYSNLNNYNRTLIPGSNRSLSLVKKDSRVTWIITANKTSRNEKLITDENRRNSSINNDDDDTEDDLSVQPLDEPIPTRFKLVLNRTKFIPSTNLNDDKLLNKSDDVEIREDLVEPRLLATAASILRGISESPRLSRARSAFPGDYQQDEQQEQKQYKKSENGFANATSSSVDVAAVTGSCLATLVLLGTMGSLGFVMYRRRYMNPPQTLNSDKCSNPDSSGYIDDSTIRDNSEEMYSLDNDSFLNSLEAMTIQNYWTDTVKHTKL